NERIIRGYATSLDGLRWRRAFVLKRLLDSVVTLDVGSSSVRTLLYSFEGREIEGFGSKLDYHARTSEAGAWEMDAAELTALAARALQDICGQLREKRVRPCAV